MLKLPCLCLSLRKHAHKTRSSAGGASTPMGVQIRDGHARSLSLEHRVQLSKETQLSLVFLLSPNELLLTSAPVDQEPAGAKDKEPGARTSLLRGDKLLSSHSRYD